MDYDLFSPKNNILILKMMKKKKNSVQAEGKQYFESWFPTLNFEQNSLIVSVEN